MRKLLFAVALFAMGLTAMAKQLPLPTDANLDTLLEAAMSTREGRVSLSEHSAGLFAKYYLERDLFACQEGWAEFLQRAKYGMILAPCGSGKSVVVSEVLPTKRIAYNRNIRILDVSKSDGLAMKNLKAVRTELETNPRLIADFGPFYHRENKWTDHQLYVIRDKRSLKDPTLEAVGVLGAVTGGRFDLIILDDILDDMNTMSAQQRSKINNYITGTLVPRLEPWGVIWVIGTRKHPDDWYGHKLKDKSWRSLVQQAINREPDHNLIELDEPYLMKDTLGNEFLVNYRVDFASDDRGEILTPERWTIEDHILLRKAMGTIIYNREYGNIVSSDATAQFKLAWLERCKDESLSYFFQPLTDRERERYKWVVQGSDPSLVPDEKHAEATDSDNMVIWTIGVTPNGMRELIGANVKRGQSPGEVEANVKAEFDRYQPDIHFMEVNSFGIIFKTNIVANYGLRLKSHYTGSNKHHMTAGLPALATQIENGRYRFPYKTERDKQITDELIAELFGYGTEPKDDRVMALWVGDSGIQRLELKEARDREEGQRADDVDRA